MYVYRKDMEFYPDVSMPWYDQVLDLERRGKPTTPAAHNLAVEAKRRKAKEASREQGQDG